MKTIICDIDGTIADLSHRLHFIQDKNGKKLDNPDWESFYMACGDDEPIKTIIDILDTFFWDSMDRHRDINFVFLTGRSESIRRETVMWLDDNICMCEDDYSLLMRKQNDCRPDTEVKPDLLKDYLKDFPETEIAFILEDRNSMVKKWRELGYTVLQVADGNF